MPTNNVSLHTARKIFTSLLTNLGSFLNCPVSDLPKHRMVCILFIVSIRKPLCQTNALDNDVFYRCASAWNSLPSSVIKSKSVVAFNIYRTIDLYFLAKLCFSITLSLRYFVCKIVCYCWCDISGFILCDDHRVVHRFLSHCFNSAQFTACR